MIADGCTVELDASTTVPISVRGENCEILLTGVLHRITGHAGIDTGLDS